VANAAVAPGGAMGSIDVFASDDTDVILDINGYFAAPSSSGKSFYPINPCRVQQEYSYLSGARTYPMVSGPCGIPSNAEAFAISVTATPSGGMAYLTLWPAGQGMPLASTLNAFDGAVTSNLALVPGGNGSISAFTSAPAMLTFDVSGYFKVPDQYVTHTIRTLPAGLSLTVDSVPCTSPCIFNWTPGSPHTIGTTSPQSGPSGTRYVFSSWSDGGGISHSMNAQSSPATYTANFTTQYFLTTAVNPAGTGSVNPASGWYNGASPVQITATPSIGYQFSNFTGTINSTSNPLTVTMNSPVTETANFTDTLTSTNLTDFQSCIGSAGLVKNCVLMQDRYAVNTPLRIQRSGINVRGGGGPGDTILYRNSANLVQIMVADANVSDVSVKNLTFDGNRYGPGLGLNCRPGNAHFFDLDLRSGGTFTVQWTDFINAPGWALIFTGDGSSVSLSNFGQGGYGYAPDGQLRALTDKESATRSTAIWIEGSNNGAWYNRVSYAGTAAINLHGSHQHAYGNLLLQNRYEISDGSQGGQLFLDPSSLDARVTGNVIDGNFWPDYSNGPPEPATGCQLPPTTQFNNGVEAYGFEHYFFNNEIEKHTGPGMQFAGSHPTGKITISSENPNDPSDTPRFIEMNKGGGIWFLGPSWTEYTITAQGVALYKINARNNAIVDVNLDSVSNDGTLGYYGAYHGFVGDSCIIPGVVSADYYGPVAGVPGVNGSVPPPYNNTLTHPIPTSYGAYPPSGTCPDPGWPAQTPARSYIPGWHW
jgi:hypothetical protein